MSKIILHLMLLVTLLFLIDFPFLLTFIIFFD